MTHLQGYKRDAIKSPIFITLEVICELLLPLVMAEIVDVAIPAGDVAYICKMGAIMLLLSLAAMACGVLSAKYSTFASQGFGANLRQCLFDKVQDFSFSDIDRFSSASLITRMTNDVNAMTMMLNMGLRMLVRAPVMLIAALCISISINPRLAIVLLVVIPLMMLAIGILMKICTRLFEAMQKKIDGLNNTLQENLIAIRVVKAFVRENHERNKFKKSNDELMDAALNVGLKVIAIMPIMMLAMNQACAHRINEVLKTEPSVEDKPHAKEQALPAPKGQVEFRNVSFKYVATGTGDDVLSNISFTVKPGSFVAIVGGTGTGKSSLVNLIPRFYDVTGGAVLVDGMDVRDYPLEELRSRIGMVLQTNVLFTGTIRENLLWGRPDATEEEIIQAAKDAQAYDFIMSFPDGFDTMLTQGGTNVSGGQKQRLCIARAMLRKPAILILDDSTSAVDSATEAAIRESFQKNLKDTTVIIIAQRISSVQYADEILILDDDHIAGQGTHEELLANNAIYQEIYQSQQEGVGE